MATPLFFPVILMAFDLTDLKKTSADQSARCPRTHKTSGLLFLSFCPFSFSLCPVRVTASGGRPSASRSDKKKGNGHNDPSLPG